MQNLSWLDRHIYSLLWAFAALSICLYATLLIV
jgi:hypothetical protein